MTRLLAAWFRGSVDRPRTTGFRPTPERLEDRVVPVLLPEGFVATVFAEGLTAPTAMEFVPDGRLFVAEQVGRIRVVKDGRLLAAPLLNLDVDSRGERGLIGLTIDPDFENNSYLYVHYTTASQPIQNRVSRFTVHGDVADPASEVTIFTIGPLGEAQIHNGGALHFGADGTLFIGVGDTGRPRNAASLDNPFGKLLRINPDGSIPTDNPFYDVAHGSNRAIWALGLRNPYTFAIQPGTGLMYINDVGSTAWEEINEGVAGANYGWPETEGPTSDPRFHGPLFAYTHGSGTEHGCAIVGGAFYNPVEPRFPEKYLGQYFFADYCNGWIRRLDPETHGVSDFASELGVNLVDLRVGPDGTLYYLTRGFGPSGNAVYRILHTTSDAPIITRHPVNRLASVGHSATFRVEVHGTEPLSFQWQRDGVPIPGSNSPTLTLDTVFLDDHGARFRVVVTNPHGRATSRTVTLSVTGQHPPDARITSPPEGTRYVAGQTVSFRGTGTDPVIGDLPASAFTWWVDFHHDDHTHPFLQPRSGSRSITFTIPTVGETDANVWYRAYLTVRNPAGLSHTVYHDIHPYTVSVQLVTQPSGLQLRLDGQPVTTPHAFISVVGMPRTIQAVSPQVVAGTTFVFDAWSNEGDPTQTITPSFNATYRAMFRERDGRAELMVYRPTEARWFAQTPAGRGRTGQLGEPHVDIPVPGDYDGDSLIDLAVYRPPTATWIINQTTGGTRSHQFGAAHRDLPVPGDYDGDGFTDLAVFRPDTAEWFLRYSGGGSKVVQFGAANLDIPVPGDYNGDGFTDLAVYRPTTAEWFLRFANGGSRVVQFGAAHLDRPIPADYDGDGAWDLAVYRPTTAEWFLRYSGGGSRAVQFGAAGMDIPVPADYDGDRKADLTVFRPTTATWFLQQSHSGPRIQQFGAARIDVPALAPLVFRYSGAFPDLGPGARAASAAVLASASSPSGTPTQHSESQRDARFTRSTWSDAIPILALPPSVPSESERRDSKPRRNVGRVPGLW